MDDQRVQRLVTTRRFLDKRREPWEVVEEELPTTTKKVFARGKQGTALDTGAGRTIMGSYRITGSHYDFAPGTYSYRVTRRSVHIGSYENTNCEIDWELRHSREGTVDRIPFLLGTPAKFRGRDSNRAEAFGQPLAPLYSFGPGTIWTYFNPKRGTVRVFSVLEGLVG